MLCRKPYSAWHGIYPCGQCMPCRINRRRVWAHRILLESLMHGDNTFVTLTYEDDNVRDLEPIHAQDWLKRIRKRYAPMRLRFYLVGEYGDASLRPHYHAALFGGLRCHRGQTRIKRGEKRAISCCAQCSLLQDSWSFGLVHQGLLERQSANYLAGYVTKKMTDNRDPRLDGRTPEFARMSLRPGLGYHAMHEVASTFMQYDLEGDVPFALGHGKKLSLLGRYLRRNLRLMTGKNVKAPPNPELQEKMRALLLRSITNQVSLKEQSVSETQGSYASLIGRQKLYSSKRSI